MQTQHRRARTQSWRGRITLLLLGLIGIVLTGCEQPGQITEYTVPRPVPAVTSRMLAALVPHQDQAWFFKLSGPTAAIDPQADNFDEFLRSVTFDERGEPKWTLPSGWTQLTEPANEMRFATIEIGEQDATSGKPALALAVSKLPYLAERHQQYALININRWRGQMQLDPIAAVELADETREVKLADATATVVDLRGDLKPDSMAPFAGKLAASNSSGTTRSDTNSPNANSTSSGPSAAGNENSTTKSAARPTVGALPDLPLTFAVPDGWRPGDLKAMRVAAYQVADGDQRAEITIIPLGLGSGEMKANIDRWRGEIKLPPTESVEAAKALLRQIEVDGQMADFVELVGPADAKPRESTLGAILRRPDSVWFFKMRGSAALVEREKSRFEDFVRSVKFK